MEGSFHSSEEGVPRDGMLNVSWVCHTHRFHLIVVQTHSSGTSFLRSMQPVQHDCAPCLHCIGSRSFQRDRSTFAWR